MNELGVGSVVRLPWENGLTGEVVAKRIQVKTKMSGRVTTPVYRVRTADGRLLDLAPDEVLDNSLPKQKWEP